MPIDEFLITRDLFSHEKDFKQTLFSLIIGKNNPKHQIPLDNIRLGLFESLIRPNIHSFELDKNSRIRIIPDLTLAIKDLILCPIEIESYLSRKEQFNQINTYFKVGAILNTNAIANENSILVHYLKYFSVFSIFISCSDKIKKDIIANNTMRPPLIFLEISENWQLMPKKSVLYKAFDLLMKMGKLMKIN